MTHVSFPIRVQTASACVQFAMLWLITSAEVDDRVYVGSQEWRQRQLDNNKSSRNRAQLEHWVPSGRCWVPYWRIGIAQFAK
jgi:hypothetical protein